jgi:hypothetical protein
LTDGVTYEHDICGCYKYVGTPLAYDDAVFKCASMNGELVKIDRGIIQLKIEHLIDYSSMQFTFVLLHLSLPEMIF